jgi:hypothetical protein
VAPGVGLNGGGPDYPMRFMELDVSDWKTPLDFMRSLFAVRKTMWAFVS